MLPTQEKPFPWKCGACRERAVTRTEMPYSLEYDYDGGLYSVTVPNLQVPRCEKCGRLVFDSFATDQIDDAFREQVGLLKPEEIRGKRKELNLTQRELAEQLGVAEATLCRWETGGQIQQRSLDRLLRLYFEIPAVREKLAERKRESSAI